MSCPWRLDIPLLCIWFSSSVEADVGHCSCTDSNVPRSTQQYPWSWRSSTLVVGKKIQDRLLCMFTAIFCILHLNQSQKYFKILWGKIRKGLWQVRLIFCMSCTSVRYFRRPTWVWRAWVYLRLCNLATIPNAFKKIINILVKAHSRFVTYPAAVGSACLVLPRYWPPEGKGPQVGGPRSGSRPKDWM